MAQSNLERPGASREQPEKPDLRPLGPNERQDPTAHTSRRRQGGRHRHRACREWREPDAHPLDRVRRHRVESPDPAGAQEGLVAAAAGRTQSGPARRDRVLEGQVQQLGEHLQSAEESEDEEDGAAAGEDAQQLFSGL